MLERKNRVIMGARVGRKGAGVINHLTFETREQGLKKLIGWRIAMPDWNFVYLEYSSHGIPDEFYKLDLNTKQGLENGYI